MFFVHFLLFMQKQGDAFRQLPSLFLEFAGTESIESIQMDVLLVRVHGFERRQPPFGMHVGNEFEYFHQVEVGPVPSNAFQETIVAAIRVPIRRYDSLKRWDPFLGVDGDNFFRPNAVLPLQFPQ